MKKILIMLTCLIILISCLDYENYKIPGYSGIDYISENINVDTGIIKTTFFQDSVKGTYLLLDLVLENLENNRKELNDGFLKNAIIYDRKNKIKLINLVNDIKIKITGKNTNINVNNNSIIEINTHFSIIERNKFLLISIAIFQTNDRKCYIEIEAPNINLQTWKAQFVIGTGESGSL